MFFWTRPCELDSASKKGATQTSGDGNVDSSRSTDTRAREKEVLINFFTQVKVIKYSL